MITLTSIDHVNAAPEKVWYFLTHLHEVDAYLQWHPKDHKSFRLLSGDGETVGSTFNAVEVLGGREISLQYRLNQAVRHKYLEYSYLKYGAIGLLGPLHLVTGTFTLRLIEPNQTEFTAQIHIGYKLPIIDWLVRLFVDMDAIQKHMAEEGRNLSRVLRTKEG